MRLIHTKAATTVAASAALVAAGLAAAPTAQAAGQLNPATSFDYTVHQDGTVVAPTDGSAIPNIDSVKSTIRAYYGATKGDNPAHAFDASAPATTYLPNLTTSAYAKNTTAVAEGLLDALPDVPGAADAVVFDVDSTLLSDYANEEEMNYNYSPALNGNWVTHQLMPAVPGMVAAVKTLAAEGYAIYGITGRPAGQEDDTIGNLTGVGYADSNGPLFDADNLYTKPADNASQPSYITGCAIVATATLSKCTTVQYKALTRQHLEDGGADIVMNVGDQWSDLQGGFADDTQKVPNPTYYLGSPNIAGAPASDADMKPPTHYTMAPDGSTGATTTDGDNIPNEGNVATLIRAYYGATGGIADKTSSPYISQLASLESAWTSQITTACQRGAAKVAAAQTAIVGARAVVTEDARAVRDAARDVRKAKRAVKRSHGRAKRAAKRRLAAAERVLTRAERRLARAQRTLAGITVPRSPAAVFDADDTTLWTYDMEDGNPTAPHAGMQFNFNPTLQNDWVQNEWFLATPGMPAVVKAVQAAGCTIVGLTGRNTGQQAATIDNLTKVGYVDAAGRPLFTAANYYTKWVSGAPQPSYIDCGDDKVCSTIEYKAGTREYLETQKGLDIVANLGDQFSDLHGGYADSTYKLPNPTYYLP
ncbi:HAD superfamily, subfamily IIIB (Acid phosphatase) [Nocardioides terrae]|uniref:HAD superfamily, subfamily IIIB (Acid phosphatase) n=1 Tax=Nocardioides terrae TaxID=574651 RepID=A0A1I1LQ42_9ACTN|nr:HAD family acid phosphatase [Nocardioides terrae]SFC71590.1 HAD superfamily, subfamily IIIB (Acid phosphatase) [Nocardioides terrae]